MNSDSNESNKRPNEASEQEKETAGASSTLKKFHGIDPNEHAKPRRRGRRGKKRKQRKVGSGGAAECNVDQHAGKCNVDQHAAECEKHCMSWDSDEEDIEIEDYNLLGDVMIRPTDVPKAPENSTQFIIDDHDECRLYKSFETPFLPENNNSEIIEPEGEDAAYVDINYEYESPHDFDNSAYYDREFELSYKNNRYDELLRLSREELITGLRNLQEHIQDLNDELIRQYPDTFLERLQRQLLEQQEKHSLLKEQNSRLEKCLEEAGVDYQLLEEQFLQAEAQQGAGVDYRLLEEQFLEDEEEHNVENTSEKEFDVGENIEDRLCEPGGSLSKQSPLSVYNQKESPCYIPCINASNKESARYDEMTFEERLQSPKYAPLLESCNDSCSEAEESLGRQSTQSPLSAYNQKENSESPCHIPCMDASNKENACYDEINFDERLQSAKCTPRHESCNDSCSEHIRIKEKGILRDSEFNETQCFDECSVSPEHELNTVAV